MHIGFDDGDLDAVMPAPPFGDFGRGGGLSLSVEAYHQDRLVMRSDFSSRPEQSNQFGVDEIHRVRVETDSGTWLLFEETALDAFGEFFGLSDIEIGF